MLKRVVYLVILLSTTSCANIMRHISAPVYSLHSTDKISFKNKDKINNVYIQENADDNYGIYKKVMSEVKKKLQDNKINIVNNPAYADYILTLNIRNIAIDMDYDFATAMRQSLLSNEVKFDYVFDANNNPHINNEKTAPIHKQDKTRFRIRRLTPPVLYTLIGASAGFTIGYLLAGSVAPVAFGFLGGLVVGGTTYAIYNSLRKVGIIISYDITIEEKLDKQIKHDRKNLSKISSNMIDESFYSYNSNWMTHKIKSLVIATGSRVLIDDMIWDVCPMIAVNITNQFNSK